MRLIDADALKKDIARLHVLNDEAEIRRAYEYNPHATSTDFEETLVSVFDAIDDAPSIEPNLILPERMGRGDIYEVGETIVVMNHDDYYDLLCKSWEPKLGENLNNEYADCDQFICSECGIELRDWTRVEIDEDDGEEDHYEYVFRFCPNCGTRIKGADDE